MPGASGFRVAEFGAACESSRPGLAWNWVRVSADVLVQAPRDPGGQQEPSRIEKEQDGQGSGSTAGAPSALSPLLRFTGGLYLSLARQFAAPPPRFS